MKHNIEYVRIDNVPDEINAAMGEFIRLLIKCHDLTLKKKTVIVRNHLDNYYRDMVEILQEVSEYLPPIKKAYNADMTHLIDMLLAFHENDKAEKARVYFRRKRPMKKSLGLKAHQKHTNGEIA